MNVKMPSGQIVRNVPDNITEADLLKLYSADTKTPEPAPELPSKILQRQDAAQYMDGLLPASGRAADANVLVQALGGARAAVERAGMGAKRLIPGMSLTPENEKLLRQGDAFLKQTGPTSTVADMAATGGLLAAPGGWLERGAQWAGNLLPRALQAAGVQAPRVAATGRTAVTNAANVAGQAGLGALVSPEDPMSGAAGGLAGYVLGATGQRAGRGFFRDSVRPQAQWLMDNTSIQPTVGQAVGGALNTMEQKATSMPYVGSSVKNARNRATTEYAREVTAMPLPPAMRGGLPNNGIGDEAVHTVNDRISDMYANALDRFPPQFQISRADLLAAADRAAAARGLNDADRADVLASVNRLTSDTITPARAKQFDSELGQDARGFTYSNTYRDRRIGEVLSDVHQQYRQSLQALGDSFGGDAGQALREADAAYRAFLPIDRAAASSVAQNAAVTDAAGRLQPRLMRRAIEAEDPSKNNRASRRVAAGMDPYERPVRPGDAASTEPDITVGPRTPMGTAPGTDIVPAGGGSGFDYTGNVPALPGPVRPGAVGPVRPGEAPDGAVGPVRAAAQDAGDAGGGGYGMDTTLQGTPPNPRADEINYLTRQAETILPDFYGDSGSAGRLGLMGAIPTTYAFGHVYGGPAGGLGAVAAMSGLGVGARLGSSRAVQRWLLQGGPRSQALADAVSPLVPGVAAGLGAEIGAPSADDRLQQMLRQAQRSY